MDQISDTDTLETSEWREALGSVLAYEGPERARFFLGELLREALRLVRERAPDLEAEGEMHADTALSKRLLDQVFPDSRLTAAANLLVMPNLDAANITFNALKIVAGQGVTVGPILLGAAKPVHILTPTSTVRRLVNLTALAAVDASAKG
jgi:malate dehydrogenase (oxaloacetate-decarboxylating)(NADP+)